MSFADTLQDDNFVWNALVDHLPHDRRRGYGKFDININCPMCVTRGEARPDTRFRCGIKESSNGLGINCFNCRFKVRWRVGEYLPDRLKDFMVRVGVGETEVKRIALRAYSIARTFEANDVKTEDREIYFNPSFAAKKLPEGSKELGVLLNEGCDDPRFLRAVEYIASRGEDIARSYDYYWTDKDEGFAERLIIPGIFRNETVGFTARATNPEETLRYYSFLPDDFLFNNESLYLPHRKFVFLLEGPLDAIGVRGVSTLGAKLSENQALWIKSSGKIPVLVVDRDRQGIFNIENAVKHGWHVAFPRLASRGWWDAKVKDAAKAVELYGSLYTVRSILENMTDKPNEIEIMSRLSI